MKVPEASGLVKLTSRRPEERAKSSQPSDSRAAESRKVKTPNPLKKGSSLCLCFGQIPRKASEVLRIRCSALQLSHNNDLVELSHLGRKLTHPRGENSKSWDGPGKDNCIVSTLPMNPTMNRYDFETTCISQRGHVEICDKITLSKRLIIPRQQPGGKTVQYSNISFIFHDVIKHLI